MWIGIDDSADKTIGDDAESTQAEGAVMTDALGLATGFYISSIQMIVRGQRTYRGSRADGTRDSLTMIQTLMPSATFGYGIVFVNGPQAVHNAMGGDVIAIYAPPMTALTTWGQLTTAKQASLTAHLETKIRLPMDSVVAGTTLGSIVRQAMVLVLCTQRLQTDFPTQALDALWATVPALQQLAIIDFLNSGAIETLDILPTSPLRVVLSKLAAYPFGSISVGGESF